MKKSLLKVFAVGVLICASLSVNAQAKEDSDVYRYEVWEDGNLTAVYIFDSYNDFLKFEEYQSKDGWLYGMGEATGDLNKKKAIHIKREAQDAAFDQIAGQLLRYVQRELVDYRHEGERDGYLLDDSDWEDLFVSRIKGVLPQASMQFAYKIEKPINKVTYVVGVGIDMEKAEKKAQEERNAAIQEAYDQKMNAKGRVGSKQREASRNEINECRNRK